MQPLFLRKIDPDFVPYSSSALQDTGENKNNRMSCDNGKNSYYKSCFTNSQFYYDLFLLKVFLYQHISFLQYPEKVYDYFTA